MPTKNAVQIPITIKLILSLYGIVNITFRTVHRLMRKPERQKPLNQRSQVSLETLSFSIAGHQLPSRLLVKNTIPIQAIIWVAKTTSDKYHSH